MKSLLTIIILTLLTGMAPALEPGDIAGAMGIYFSDTEFTVEQTNIVDPPAFFEFYVVLRELQIYSLGGYECGLSFVGAGMSAVGATGPQGWFNWGGEPTNQIVTFNGWVPVPASGDLVIATVFATYVGSDPVDIYMGPSDPSSGENNAYGFYWRGPIIAGNDCPELLLCCTLTSGAAGYEDIVATVNGDSPVAIEGRTLSGVRGLFR